jgi:2-oxoglutarate decarboxylase
VEEASQAVAESSRGASPAGQSAGSRSADDPLAEFGANEWLVDEMYEQYQRDPNSVDKVWWDFFKDNAPGDGTTNGQTKPSTEPAKAPAPPSRPPPSPPPRSRP